MIVHEPQSPRSQPILGLLIPIRSRRTSSNTSAGAASSVQSSPLTVVVSFIVVLSDQSHAVIGSRAGEPCARLPQTSFEHHLGHTSAVFGRSPHVGDRADLIGDHGDNLGNERLVERLAPKGVLDAGRPERGRGDGAKRHPVLVLRIHDGSDSRLRKIFPGVAHELHIDAAVLAELDVNTTALDGLQEQTQTPDVKRQIRTVEDGIKGIRTRMKKIGLVDRMVGQLSRMGKSSEAIAKSLREFAVVATEVQKAFAQNDVVETFRQRPAIFKTQNIDTGAEWEGCSGLTGIRYKQPDIVFSDQIIIQGKELDILVEHHPGPAKGASWVVVPERKVIFIGDAVVVKQPPFLANADLPAWIETIDFLLIKQKGNKIISGRGGLINEKHIRSMRKLLVDLNKRMERLGKRKASPEETVKMVPKILANTESPTKYKDLYSQRLKYGLYHCYARNYFPKKSEK